MLEPHNVSETSNSNAPVELDMDLAREVIHCKTCGLVQYRTRMGNCRRCLCVLPLKVMFLNPPAEPQELQDDDRQLCLKRPNRETVNRIGQRIQLLRESREMTQSQLHARSQVSRSYLSRIENGEMTPSLRTLEKLSEALDVNLKCFFVPVLNGEALLGDPFIQDLRPFLRQLDWKQWQSILKRLAAVCGHVAGGRAQLRPLAEPQAVRMDRPEPPLVGMG